LRYLPFLLALKKPGEAGQFRRVQIRDAGESKTILFPGDFVIAVGFEARGRR
jgi:hypothetical protein